MGCYQTKNSGAINKSALAGTFYKDGEKNFFLKFDKNRFFYIENSGPALYMCCDTITEGVYKIDRPNRLLYLTTPEYLDNLFLDVNVREQESSVLDSVFFHITNPVESDYLGESKTNRLFYKVIAECSDFSFISKIEGTTYDNPNFKIYLPRNIELTNISLQIIPNYNFLRLRSSNVKAVFTSDYEIQNKNNRVFNISIPSLTLPFLSYLRLNKDMIRIIDSNKLEWDGHYFIK